MSVQTAAGVPQLADQGAIIQHFTDEVNVTYYEETKMPKITNSKFTGQIKDVGDKVTIPERPVIEIHDYKKGGTIQGKKVYPWSNIVMNVNRAKTWTFTNDHIDIKQSHLMLNDELKQDAVKRMDIAIENDFFTDLVDKAAAANRGGTAGAKLGGYNLGTTASPVSVHENNVVKLIASINAVFGEQNAREGKKINIIMPEWMRYVLLNSDLKNAMVMGDDTSAIRSGLIGKLVNMDLYVSNLLPYVDPAAPASGSYVFATNNDAVAYVAQLTKTRMFEEHDTYGVTCDGLMVFDWKVVKPEGLVQVVAKMA